MSQKTSSTIAKYRIRETNITSGALNGVLNITSGELNIASGALNIASGALNIASCRKYHRKCNFETNDLYHQRNDE